MQNSVNRTPAEAEETKFDFSTVTALQLLDEAVSIPSKLSEIYNLFHNFSVNNQLLALMQFRNFGLAPSPLKTYRQWGELGRKVKKGAKCFYLWMPKVATVKSLDKDDTGEVSETKRQVMRGFMLRKQWFALNDTYGADIEENDTPQWNEKQALEKLNIKLVPFVSLNGNIQGYAQQRKIAILPITKFRKNVLFHEMAHILLGHTNPDCKLLPEIIEVQAEAVAYICINVLGLKGKEDSRAYIQHYLEYDEIPEEVAKDVIKCANEIIKAGEVRPDKQLELGLTA